jgi:hypothetical protein
MYFYSIYNELLLFIMNINTFILVLITFRHNFEMVKEKGTMKIIVATSR